jgi:hypothetical protein
MKNTLTVLSICLLLISSLAFASEAGAVDPAPFPGVGQASPLVMSKFFILEAPVKSGTAQVRLPLDTPARGIALVLGETSVKARGADQRALEPLSFRDEEMKRMNMPAANTRFSLDSLSPGLQALTLYDLNDARQVRMVISQPESRLELQVQVKPLAARCGENVTVTAHIEDERLPQEASVIAALPNGKTVKLNDNGQEGDLVADDGIYSGTFAAPRVTGFQGINIRFTALGKRFNGTEFQRNSINTVMVTQPQGSILEEKITVNPNEIMVPLAAARGNYRVEIIFGVEGTSLAYSRENVTLQGNPAAVRLPLPGEALAADRAVVRLLNKDTLGLEEEVEIHLTPTQAPPDFQSISAQAPPMPDSKRQAAEKINNEKENNSQIDH